MQLQVDVRKYDIGVALDPKRIVRACGVCTKPSVKIGRSHFVHEFVISGTSKGPNISIKERCFVGTPKMNKAAWKLKLVENRNQRLDGLRERWRAYAALAAAEKKRVSAVDFAKVVGCGKKTARLVRQLERTKPAEVVQA